MTQRLLHARSIIGWLLAIAAGSCLFASAAVADGFEVQTATAWKQNAAPMGWSASLNRVIYNSLGTDGMFDAYSAKPDGSDPRCLTCTVPSVTGVGTTSNRGATDVSPDGKYMLVSVERSHPGSIGAAWTQPGKGGANDVWLESTDGTQAWPLTDIYAAGQQAVGTNWARFDRTGNEIVWGSMYTPAFFNLGYWQLKVANVVWTSGVPRLANVRTIEPQASRFYEPYGFSPDDSHIIFSSDTGMPNWMDSQIDSIATDGTGLTRLSPADSPPGVLTSYNEFAFYTPDNNWIIYGRSHDASGGGLDYWMMHPDGSDQQRLTYFNQRWSTESLGYTVAGGLAFDPSNPNVFIAGGATDASAEHINAEMVTLNPEPKPTGLTQQYYNQQYVTGQAFGQPTATNTQNPSDGWEQDASPAPGVASSHYSIRWSGNLTAPLTGTYSLCIVADYSAQLYVAGTQLVNGWYSYGQRKCATVAETAGATSAITLNYEHGLGTGFAQLSWILPGSTTPSAIPSADL